jgi:holo-[acyl-carrier protein] synthase
VIIGLGSDLCNIERIANSLERYGDAFRARVHPGRTGPRTGRPFTRAGTLAKRFAAKEACSKALGTGFAQGVFMKDIGVVNAHRGAPTLALDGAPPRALPR